MKRELREVFSDSSLAPWKKLNEANRLFNAQVNRAYDAEELGRQVREMAGITDSWMMACMDALRRAEAAESENKRLRGELADRHYQIQRALESGESSREVWYWQGDGDDHLESLTCPILITPDKLKAALSAKETK